MAIKRPDVYQHNNPNLAVVDATEVRGGVKSVINLTDKYNIPSDKLKNGSWCWVASELRFYILTNIANKGNASGWVVHNPVPVTRTLTGSTGIHIDNVKDPRDLTTNRVISVDSTVVRESNNNVITGLKSTRRAGSNNGTSPNIVHRYEIDVDADLYKLDIMNTQNQLSTQGEVFWYFRSTFNRAFGIPKVMDMQSFFKGVLVTGARVPSASVNADLSTWYTGSAEDFPLKGYHVGVNQYATGIVVGTTNGEAYENITGNTKIWVNGSIRATGDITPYSTSDRRLKDNITKIENALDKICKLGGYTFDWNDKQVDYSGKDYGIIAQEVQEIMPELVKERFDQYLHVNMVKIIPLIIEAIKEIREKIEQ